MYNAYEKSPPHTIPSAEAGRGVHAIVVEVVVPQPEISRFTITIDISSMTFWPSC
jgi:hypothetical protein